MMKKAALSSQERLALWDRAWRIAQSRCRDTLARLRRGEGGFYDADDFRQDAYIEFHRLLDRWLVSSGNDRAALWRSWRRCLHKGGIRILHRKPQRLWSGPDDLPLAKMSLAEAASDEAVDGLVPLEGLMSEENDAEDHGRHQRLVRMLAALWRLTPLQRQALYMLAIEGMPADDVARCLGISSRNAIYQLVVRARQGLIEQLYGERERNWEVDDDDR